LPLLDDVPPRPHTAGLRAFELILILVVLTEYWLRALPKWGQLAPAYNVHLAAASLLCLLALRPQWRRAALGALAVSHAVLVWREFPATGNHAYLEVVFFLLATLLSPDDDGDAAIYTRAVRWLVIVVFFWSGVQKLVHGFWFDGSYLAFSLDSAGFRPVLGLLIPADELTRLATYTGEVGDGPYIVRSFPLLALSNGTWLLELALAPLLLWPKTRTAAALIGVILVAAIQVGARELFFGLVFANAILLFLPGTTHRRLVLPVAALLALMIFSRLGALPEAVFH
jgi:hypothetical protein